MVASVKKVGKITSVKKAAPKKVVKKKDEFLLLLPHCLLEDRHLPILSALGHCFVFTDREKLKNWRETMKIPVSRTLRYTCKSRLPKFVRAIMIGKRPAGLLFNMIAQTSEFYTMPFQSKADDLKLSDDLERIHKMIFSVKEEKVPVRADSMAGN